MLEFGAMALRTLLLFCIFLLPVGFVRESWPQSTSSPGGMHLPPLAEQSQGMGVPMKTEDQVNQERLQKYRMLRQQELLRDATKLHQLSGELKDYLDKSGSTILSVEMLKKAEAVEKLAHSVRSKMKDLQ
jgi:hypothetical protein